MADDGRNGHTPFGIAVAHHQATSSPYGRAALSARWLYQSEDERAGTGAWIDALVVSRMAFDVVTCHGIFPPASIRV